MSKVIAAFAMSLDGFIADAQDGVQHLFRWLATGNTPVSVQGRDFQTSAASARVFQARLDTTGAIVTGRRDFDVSRAWHGKPPLDVPVFIVTHTAPPAWNKEGTPFTFVTEGVERAIAQARQVAGDKCVTVSGSKITQQALKAGLLDEIHIDLVPMLLGAGVRLFEDLDAAPHELETISAIHAPGVTHLQFRVEK
jgi:dihydrofolate reductase